MQWIDFVIIGVIVLIVGGAAAYIIKAKKSGKKCIGCPDSCACSKKNDGSACSCNCGYSDEKKPNNQ